MSNSNKQNKFDTDTYVSNCENNEFLYLKTNLLIDHAFGWFIGIVLIMLPMYFCVADVINHRIDNMLLSLETEYISIFGYGVDLTLLQFSYNWSYHLVVLSGLMSFWYGGTLYVERNELEVSMFEQNADVEQVNQQGQELYRSHSASMLKATLFISKILLSFIGVWTMFFLIV